MEPIEWLLYGEAHGSLMAKMESMGELQYKMKSMGSFLAKEEPMHLLLYKFKLMGTCCTM